MNPTPPHLMTDRELMLATYHKAAAIGDQLRDLNGQVKDHHIELYGDTGLQAVGLKEMAVRNTATIKTGKTILTTVVGVVSIIGLANLIAMLTLFARLNGG